MIPLAWRNVKSWNCIECAKCCKDYHVVLNYNEWINIVKTFGINNTLISVNRLLLGKKKDGTCSFLTCTGNHFFCKLQHMKPLACKIWPFKILNRPKFGDSNKAIYRYEQTNFFVYVDPECKGLLWGKPIPELKYKVIPEFIEVAIGIRRKQIHSTSNFHFRYNKLLRERAII